MPRARKNLTWPWEQKVTYHRDVAKERRELRKHAMEERREKLARKKQEAVERVQDARDEKARLAKEAREEKRAAIADAKAERERKAERRKSDAEDRKIEREMREQGNRNPSFGYGVYTKGFMGETQLAHFKSKSAAETWARSHGVTGYKVKRAFAKNPRNPVDEAAALSESWHGRPAEKATDYKDTFRYHGNLTDLGRLKEISIHVSPKQVQPILFDKHTRLASSENGKQLYVVGGDQSLDLKALGIRGAEAEKDLIPIGDVHSIVYVTAKMHLGAADKQAGPYEHHLGEDSGVMPILMYDRLNQEVAFAGGNYFIDPTDYDGSHSAGIRD